MPVDQLLNEEGGQNTKIAEHELAVAENQLVRTGRIRIVDDRDQLAVALAGLGNVPRTTWRYSDPPARLEFVATPGARKSSPFESTALPA